MSLRHKLIKSFWKIVKNVFFYALALICGGLEVIWFVIKQKFLGNQLPNYSVVEENSLHRGGMPSEKGIEELTKNGIKTIINLRWGNFSEKVIEEYRQDKVRIFYLPFSPYDPTDQIMINVLKILINPNHKPAFVHCFHGADRTGAVCAIYRIIVQNWDKEKAIAEMQKKGLHFWHTNMIEYIQKLDVAAIKASLQANVLS
jgi:tyrosine-protein phosphatase SIW14